MQPSRLTVLFIAAIASLVPGNSFAQGGAAIVRISDGAGSRCINPAKDQIWLTLRRAIIEKKTGWILGDKSVEALFSAQVRAQNVQKPITFPLSAETSLRSFSNGQVSVPIEYSIVDGLTLKQQNATYTGIQLDVTMLNLQKRTAWGNALQALAQTANKLPLPNTPVTQAATYLLDFANTAVDKDIQQVKDDDKARSASLALNFDPRGTCSGNTDFERTGTVAVIQDKGDLAGLMVPISDINKYCWTADLKPVFLLKAALKDNVACSDAAHYAPKFKQITNNYVGFFLNAVETTGQLAETPESKKDRDLAYQRCTANGVPRESCLAIR